MTLEKEPNRTAAFVLAVLVGSGGTAVIAPKVAPGWYRPDPARGSELREIRADAERLRQEFRDFRREGPREVRKNQDIMLLKLDAVLRILATGCQYKQ